MAAVVPIADYRRAAPYLSFSRQELQALLNLYTSRVMLGEWRDYALNHGPTMASFFIFQHTQDNPLFVISKLQTKGKHRVAAARQGQFVLFSREKKLKQAHNLDEVLKALSRTLRLVRD
ncbi:MAG: DUF2794 domain-containing protein [Rhodospirillaceae bacterium]|nr:DUF2794 domain-containing protein [Rhodospirillaceae bacterium]